MTQDEANQLADDLEISYKDGMPLAMFLSIAKALRVGDFKSARRFFQNDIDKMGSSTQERYWIGRLRKIPFS